MTNIETFAQTVKTAVNSAICHEKFHWGIEVIPGRKFTKIAKTKADGHREVYCFVDTATGDILKPANWKSPAKGIRGNVNGDTSRCTPYGIF